MKIAAFISPHGYGHAARTSAVLSALAEQTGQLTIELFTLVPEWFFKASISGEVVINYHPLESDIGFVQKSAVEEDLPATIHKLRSLYPLKEELLDQLAEQLVSAKVDLVLADISVLGVLAARRAGIKSVLVENFTWDWIYQPYLDLAPEFGPFIEYLAPLYHLADLRIQATPICKVAENAHAIPPVARAIRTPRSEIRALLGISEDRPLIMLSMGGIQGSYPFIEQLAQLPELFFLIAGAELNPNQPAPSNLKAIPHHSQFFHPDLVAAADAIVGKVGYSTVAEAYQGNTQFFYVPRPLFPESSIMEGFVTEQLNGIALTSDDFNSGHWLKQLPQQLKPVAAKNSEGNGAATAAELILKLL